MPNEPKAAKQKRPPPPDRQNAQGDHEGSAHSPDEFDVMNPQKQGVGDGQADQAAPKPATKR
ncbi:hypothetical protein EYC08_11095 [Tabrizicola sp. WMC-M-20]|nr:hypothetical protein EYC08_11095 [Tabrizicola sp. WMC-M-20]